MSSPTRFLDFLNSTLRLTEKRKTVTGFDLGLIRLVSRIAKGYSVVKRSEAPKHTKRQRLKPIGQVRRRKASCSSLRRAPGRCRLRGFFRPRGSHEETHGSALQLLRKNADVGEPRQPRPQPHQAGSGTSTSRAYARWSTASPGARPPAPAASGRARSRSRCPGRNPRPRPPSPQPLAASSPGSFASLRMTRDGFASRVSSSRPPSPRCTCGRRRGHPGSPRIRPTIFSSCFRSEVSSETVTNASFVSSTRASIRRMLEPSPAIAWVTSASRPGRSSVETSSSIA